MFLETPGSYCGWTSLVHEIQHKIPQTEAAFTEVNTRTKRAEEEQEEKEEKRGPIVFDAIYVEPEINNQEKKNITKQKTLDVEKTQQFQALYRFHEINLSERDQTIAKPSTLENGFLLDSECVVGGLYVHTYEWPPPKIENHISWQQKKKNFGANDSTDFLFHNVERRGNVTLFSGDVPRVLVRYPASLFGIDHDTVMLWLYKCVLEHAPSRLKWNPLMENWSAYYTLGSRLRPKDGRNMLYFEVIFT